MKSQNATFAGAVKIADELDDPKGLPIARTLATQLRVCGWVAAEPDVWRDSGFSVRCERPGADLELVIAPIGPPGEWALQIAPSRLPGVLGRALGRTRSASDQDCYELAKDVYDVLAPQFTGFRWTWDAFPDASNSTPAPRPPG